MSATASRDVRDALASALNVVELAISLGAQHWDRTTPGARRDAIWTQLRALMDERERIEGLLLQVDFASPEVQAALLALDRIAAENEDIAGHLPSFTGWLEKVTPLIGQADKIVAALRTISRS